MRSYRARKEVKFAAKLSCSSCKSGCWRGTRGACAVVLGQLRWQCSEKCSCCQLKHFSGFCLVRHKLHVCVLALRHWGNHRGNMFLSGLAASSGLCCEDFSQESVKLFLMVRLVDQGCLCSDRIQIPCRGLGQLGHPATAWTQHWGASSPGQGPVGKRVVTASWLLEVTSAGFGSQKQCLCFASHVCFAWMIKGDLGNCLSKFLLSVRNGIVPSVSGWDCLGLFV